MITDRMGDNTTVEYDEASGKPAALTNATGQTTRFSYQAQTRTFTDPNTDEQFQFTFYDLVRVEYPDGTHEAFTLDAQGNMLQRTDQAGNVWAYAYNDLGLMASVTNPAGGVVEYIYNDDGTMASSTDSDTQGLTRYAYDAYNRQVRITHADDTFVEMSYDLNNRLTSVTDENGTPSPTATTPTGTWS